MVRTCRTTHRRTVASSTGNNNNSTSSAILLTQPKLEPQSLTFDQPQPPPPPPPSQTKMVPIAPRYDATQSNTYICSNCTQPIQERYFLHTRGRLSHESFWHKQCLRCQCCDVVLADISSTFYTKDNALFCKSDYIKKFGSRPCSLCSQVIGNNEQVMRVSPNYVYHLSCFSCVKCHIRLVKGDRYVLCNGQPFCEKDNPLKSTTNSPATKRGSTTSKRGAKAGRATTAAIAVPVQQAYATPQSYHHTGHISLINNPPNSSTITHPLLSNNNGLPSTGPSNSDDMY